MKVFLDLNVVLDFLLQRSPWNADADAIWGANRNGRINAAASSAALPTIFYIIRRTAGWDAARDAIDDCVISLEILSVDLAIVNSARSFPGRDFEDNLQAACAIEHGCDVLVTRDGNGFPGLPIEVLSPSELLARLP